jgi:hypothetical protein
MDKTANGLEQYADLQDLLYGPILPSFPNSL